MRLNIVGDRLLVRPNQLKKSHEVKTDEGKTVNILISHGEAERRLEAATTEGVVVQVGPLAYAAETPWCKVNDRISWGKYAGYWITDPETKDDYVILDPHDILCVIHEEKPNE